MKEMQYLSPSGLKLWDSDKDAFYMRYLSDQRPPGEPQNQAMAIGSAFDAYCKSFLHEKLMGANNDPRFDLDTIFEAQVEPQHRDWAKKHGAYVFEQYRASGALSDLLLDIQRGTGEPRFEFDLRGVVNGYRESDETEIVGVTLYGKPDVAYVDSNDNHIVLDWKVNGYCSQHPTSPMQQYIRLRSAGSTVHGRHKDCRAMAHKGTIINFGSTLDALNKEWATQLSIYAWLCGEPIGSDFILKIHQVVCKPGGNGTLPGLRFAEHACLVDPQFQLQTFRRIAECWTACTVVDESIGIPWVFRNMTPADSEQRCRLLDTRSNVYSSGELTEFQKFQRANPEPYRGQ